MVRFTGWADVELTEHGKKQAAAVARCLKLFGLHPNAVYTSLLRRARDSLQEMVNVHPEIFRVPTMSTWRLNERHYGALVGLSKEEASERMGHDQVMNWRRSWDLAPPKMSREDAYYWKDAPWAQPRTIISEPGLPLVISTEKDATMPLTESLEDCAKRVKPIWVNGIAPRVARGETVLVVAHANSIRSMIRHIDDATICNENVREIHIPASTPLVYSFRLDAPRSVIFHHSKSSTEQAYAAAKALRPVGEPSRLGMTGRYVATKEIVRLALQSPASQEDELLKEGTSFFDLIEKGLPEIVNYMEQGGGSAAEGLVVSDGRGMILHSNKEFAGLNLQDVLGRARGSKKELQELEEKLRTGLPARTRLVDYLSSGAPCERVFTIIPVYDWLQDEKEKMHSPSKRRDVGLDYNGLLDSMVYRKHSDQYRQPSHFIAKLERAFCGNDLTTSNQPLQSYGGDGLATSTQSSSP